MSLTAGTRVGPYEVVSLLGVGGMGEVYRARDVRLGRDVALKVLPDAVATDPERLARFQREAQVLAALNHPHIAAIHGLEEATAVRALVLELVEGETLAELIARRAGSAAGGPAGLTVDDALPIARQIAEALEAAHEQGVIHRDLKPANIKITPDGTVKVLDFGLAKLNSPEGSVSQLNRPDMTASPTITSPAMMTGVGMILGTAAYMAPEQAKGRPADKRSDVWAFGCVLFEMLTGKRAFEGEDVSDTLAAVLRADPDWKALAPELPVPVAVALRATLEKDRRKRPTSLAAMTFVLDHLSDLPGHVRPLEGARPSRNVAKRVAAFAAVFVIGVGATYVVIRALTPAQALPVVRFEIEPPDGTVFPGSNAIPRFAVSHDGQRIVVEAGALPNGPYQAWVRRLDRLTAEPVRETMTPSDGGVQGMFWWPGDRTVGFFDEIAHKLKKLDVQTGSVQSLLDVPENQYGGSANADGVILYASIGTHGVMRVGSGGGVPNQVTATDPKRGEVSHLWPRFLPDGRHFLYLSVMPKLDDWGIYVGTLDGASARLIIRSNGMGEFAPPDRLLFVRGESVFVQTLDMNTFQLKGEPALVAQPALVTPGGRVAMSVSDAGVLVYASGSALPLLPRTLVWADRTGKEEAIDTPIRSYVYPRVSPDGTRIALDVRDRENDIWIWDVQRKTLTRLTFAPDIDRFPVWTPDSKRIVYASGTPSRLFSVAADGTGTPKLLTQSATGDVVPTSISAAGTEVIFQNSAAGVEGGGLRVLSLTDGSIRTLVAGTGAPRNGVISPDSRWLAYESRESGRYEIYIRPYPNTDSGRWQVSIDGGNRPVWARDGRQLYFVATGGALMAVPVIQNASSLTPGTPEKLLTRPGDFTVASLNGATYDVSSDGKRFVVLKEAADAPQTNRLVVVQNWTSELQRLVPTR